MDPREHLIPVPCWRSIWLCITAEAQEHGSLDLGLQGPQPRKRRKHMRQRREDDSDITHGSRKDTGAECPEAHFSPGLGVLGPEWTRQQSESQKFDSQ